jgi:hypothetical protein
LEEEEIHIWPGESFKELFLAAAENDCILSSYVADGEMTPGFVGYSGYRLILSLERQRERVMLQTDRQTFPWRTGLPGTIAASRWIAWIIFFHAESPNQHI